MYRKTHHVVFISKDNCHLCDEMWNELMKAAREITLVVRTQTITEAKKAEYDRYRDKVPVLLIDGSEVFRYRASAREIIDALKKSDE